MLMNSGFNTFKLFLMTLTLSFVSFVSLAIEGGTLAEEERWDYSVKLSMNGYSCSGTLLNNGYVLTAAHCVTDDDGNANVDSVRIENPRETIGDAKLVFVDPEYNAEKGLNDVALLRLVNPDTSSIFPRISEIMTPKRFLEMLGGDFPYRVSMIIGYGKDENNQLGHRKIFFGNEFGISPEGEMLEADANTGSSRPGDSGSGVYLISDGKQTLSAVVSKGTEHYRSLHKNSERQKQTLTRKISADSFVVPSFCRLNNEIASKINFDLSKCNDVRDYMEILNEADESSLLYLLWVRALIENSPLTESGYHRFLSKFYLLKSFSRGAIYYENLEINISELIKELDISRNNSNYNLVKDEYKLMGSKFVELGYFDPLKSEWNNWNWIRVQQALRNLKLSDDDFLDIFEKLNHKINSVNCKYKICEAELQLNGAPRDFVDSEKGDWVQQLNLKKKSITNIIGYKEVMSLLCDQSDVKTFSENTKSLFINSGAERISISEIYDENEDRLVLTNKGKKGFEIILDKGYLTRLDIGHIDWTDSNIENFFNLLSAKKFRKEIKSFGNNDFVNHTRTRFYSPQLTNNEYSRLRVWIERYQDEISITLNLSNKNLDFPAYKKLMNDSFDCKN